MSDEEQMAVLKADETESSPVPLSAAERAGALLRSSREAAGYSLETLAAIVKVPVRKLKALEEGRLDALPEPVFVRGMVVGICRVLHADPQAILALLPATPAKRLVHDGVMAPVLFQTVGADSPYRPLEVLAKPHVRWALALVLGAWLLYFWPDIATWSQQSTPDAEVLTVSQPWVANGTVALPEQGLGSVPPVAEQAGQANTGVASVPGVQAGVSADATLVPGDELVHFKARGKTWVEVLDGKGLVVLRRVLADGEQTGAGGQPPLAVVVGNADVTEVWVRGKVFEIKSISQGNVARFEVK
jgi:cytoskeleton protein RodZ